MRIKILFAALSVLAVSPVIGDTPAPGWSYTYEMITHVTRSSRFPAIGKLCYEKVELAHEFSHVITPIGEFQFASFGIPVKKTTWLPTGASEVRATKADFERCLEGQDTKCRRTAIKTTGAVSDKACLEGTLEKPPDGVGPDWIFVVDKGLWVNPAKIEETLKAKSFQ